MTFTATASFKWEETPDRIHLYLGDVAIAYVVKYLNRFPAYICIDEDTSDKVGQPRTADEAKEMILAKLGIKEVKS